MIRHRYVARVPLGGQDHRVDFNDNFRILMMQSGLSVLQRRKKYPNLYKILPESIHVARAMIVGADVRYLFREKAATGMNLASFPFARIKHGHLLLERRVFVAGLDCPGDEEVLVDSKLFISNNEMGRDAIFSFGAMP